MTNNTTDINLDQVEEIYLTDEQARQWLTQDTPRPDIFDTPDGQVVLKDMLPRQKPKQKPSILAELGPLAEAALGPSWNANSKGKTVSPTEPTPQPIRKLERPEDAVWTFFCHNCLVTGVHDDGTVVARFTLWWPFNFDYCVTPYGNFSYSDKPIERDELTETPTLNIVKNLHGALLAWVKRGKRRTMPPGVPKLEARIHTAREALNAPFWGSRRAGLIHGMW